MKSSKFLYKNILFFKIIAIFQIFILIFYYFYSVYFAINSDNQFVYDASQFWKMPLFFTQQNNYLSIFIFLFTKKSLFNESESYKKFRIYFYTWITIVGLLYWSVILPHEIKKFDIIDFLLTCWVHFFIPMLCVYHFLFLNEFSNKKIKLKYLQNIVISLIYPLLYTLIVVFLIQLLTTEHYSVYTQATEWYYLIDPDEKFKNPENFPSHFWMVFVVPVFVGVFCAIYIYLNNKKIKNNF